MPSRAQVVAHALDPGAQLLLAAGVGQREHRLQVLDLLQAPPRGSPPTRCVGESGRAQLGVLGLQRAQLVEQRVVLVVADLRVVEDVVAVVVEVELLAQLGGALCGLRALTRSRRRRAPRAAARS